MNTDKLKQSAQEAKEAAEDFISSPQVQSAISKGKDAFNKGKEWLENGQGKEYLEKGKEIAGDVIDKVEGFIKTKTGSK